MARQWVIGALAVVLDAGLGGCGRNDAPPVPRHRSVPKPISSSAVAVVPALAQLRGEQLALAPLPPTVTETQVYALVRVSVAASANAQGHSIAAGLKVERFDSRCPGRLVRLSWNWQFKASSSNPDDPPVLIDRELLCFPISADQPPADLLGVEFTRRPASLYVMNGEDFLSPEPTAFEGAGASFFLPSIRGGYQIGVFAMAGTLETDSGVGDPRPTVAIGINAIWLTAPLAKTHYFLSADSPDHSQFNVGLIVKRGPAIEGETAEPQYIDDAVVYGDEVAEDSRNN